MRGIKFDKKKNKNVGPGRPDKTFGPLGPFWGLVASNKNDSASTQSLGTLLSYVPWSSGLVGFVEQTLLYQTLYLEFYSISKWLQYRYQLFHHLVVIWCA